MAKTDTATAKTGQQCQKAHSIPRLPRADKSPELPAQTARILSSSSFVVVFRRRLSSSSFVVVIRRRHSSSSFVVVI
ncbi:MAG TPA: hypothetical protein PLE35_01730, partial [Lentisphaeria bacterium]|nr:hypothetical protein [Lentisphaeria bacterium]